MRTFKDLHDYQKRAIAFQSTKPESAMWLDMGLGKTVITLTSIANLLAMSKVKSVLIVAPKRVCQLVWRQEAQRWEHTKHLTFSMIVGTKDQRARAIARIADVYLVNYENLMWLSSVLNTYWIKKNKILPFDGLVWDELSKMKNSGSTRAKMFRSMLKHFKWKTGLTGTPASNGYKDLFGQFLVLDEGKRLGTNKTMFENQFYYKIDNSFKRVAYGGTEDKIKELIGDITLEMNAEEYNKLPDLIINDVQVELSKDTRLVYERLEKEFFVEMENGTNLEVFNAASLTNKLLQLSNGAVYPIPGSPSWEPVHDEKLEALADIVEEAQGKMVLCWYAYRSDAERIMQRFARYRPINLTECKSEKSLNDAMTRAKQGDCPLMIAHPASAGHGLDGLQHCSNTLVWFGITWSLDLYDQANARIHRQGQGKPVICHRILCNKTMDQAQKIALEDKANTQQSLRRIINQYRQTKLGV